jgi:kumamolisin
MFHSSLAGSERVQLPGSRAVGRPDPAERLEITLLLRRKAASAFARAAASLHRHDRTPVRFERREFAEAYGSDPRDAALVASVAEIFGLAVVQHVEARRTIVLSGTVAAAERAFGVELQHFEYPGGTYRGRSGAVALPRELCGVVTAVLGLDNRPAAAPQLRVRPAASAGARAHAPGEVAALYGFRDRSAAGQTIALIELGGGFAPADLRAYFNALGGPVPRVCPFSVDHAANLPSPGGGLAHNAALFDVEVAAAVAPGSRIAVYFAPNTEAGFINAVTTAIHDERLAPGVLSISWGGPESAWTAQARTALDDALQAAALLGVTVCVASGDRGSRDGLSDGHEHVDFPASSPYALACGGTLMRTAGSQVLAETAWADPAPGGSTGGGESACFDLPQWQSGAALTLAGGVARPLERRGVPDVAGNAAPESGYRIRVGGEEVVAGGTGAAAPLWAGLIACVNATREAPLGFVNPALYANREAFRDIVAGDNGGYQATPGWDACTGLGSPAPEVFEPAAEPILVSSERKALLAPR